MDKWVFILILVIGGVIAGLGHLMSSAFQQSQDRSDENAKWSAAYVPKQIQNKNRDYNTSPAGVVLGMPPAMAEMHKAVQEEEFGKVYLTMREEIESNRIGDTYVDQAESTVQRIRNKAHKILENARVDVSQGDYDSVVRTLETLMRSYGGVIAKHKMSAMMAGALGSKTMAPAAQPAGSAPVFKSRVLKPKKKPAVKKKSSSQSSRGVPEKRPVAKSAKKKAGCSSKKSCGRVSS